VVAIVVVVAIVFSLVVIKIEDVEFRFGWVIITDGEIIGAITDGETIGGLTIGGLTIGGLTIGGLTIGGLTIGGLTIGGLTIGGLTIGGLTIVWHFIIDIQKVK
jgi:hypothetical protein